MEINFENKEGYFYIVTYDANEPQKVKDIIEKSFECFHILESVFIVRSHSNIEIENIIKPLIIIPNNTDSDYGYFIELLERNFLFGFIDKSKQETVMRIYELNKLLKRFSNYLNHNSEE